jgi:hypothetical protein
MPLYDVFYWWDAVGTYGISFYDVAADSPEGAAGEIQRRGRQDLERAGMGVGQGAYLSVVPKEPAYRFDAVTLERLEK